jgi:hypothetical protein
MARSFNGTTDKIDLANIITLSGTGARSIVGWANPSSFATASTIFGYGVEATDTRCALVIGTTGGFSLGFNNDVVNSNTAPVTTAAWQHIACTFTGGSSTGTNVLLYYNGLNVAATQSGIGSTPNTTNASFGIGYNRPGNSSFMAGGLADVAVWNTVLTPVEILALARGVRPNAIRVGSLWGYWPLDGYRHPALDLSFGAHNGVLGGSPSLVPGPPLISSAPLFPGVPVPEAFRVVPRISVSFQRWQQILMTGP